MKTRMVNKAFLLCGGMLLSVFLSAQELYVFSEPASNMPAYSVSGKLSAKFLKNPAGGVSERFTPEVMFGLNKRLMVHGALSFSDMYTAALRWESARVYGKYRILALDEVHRHFRIAAFGEVSYSENALKFDELSLEGDQSGAQGGVILTGLSGRTALSATLGYLQVFTNPPKNSPFDYPSNAFNYSLSAGYLVFPLEYKSFRQTNFNIYTELLGQRSLDLKRYTIDLAPAAQWIFNSNAKLNVGYRFQVAGNMNRMARQSWMVSFERTFLDALGKKRRTQKG